MVLTEEEWGMYAELRGEARADRSIRHLLGHPDTTQPFAMEGAYATVRPRLFPALPDRAALAGETWQQELEDVRLL